MENPKATSLKLFLIATLFIAGYKSQPSSTTIPSTISPYVCPSYGIFGLCSMYSGLPCCGEFYSCSAAGTNGVLFSCSNGFIFSDLSNNPKCVSNQSSIIEPGMCGSYLETEPPFYCPSNTNGFFKDPQCSYGCCSQYFVCVQGNAFAQTCADGYTFDPNILACVTIDSCSYGLTTVRPTSPPFVCPSETANGFFADPSCPCCNNYYICNQGTSYPMICLDEGVFDSYSSSCRPASGCIVTPGPSKWIL